MTARLSRVLLSWCIIGSCRAQGGLSSSSPTSPSPSLSSTPPPHEVIDFPRYLKELPACGAACLNASISAGQCTNTTSCVCSHQPFTDVVNGCIKSSCDLSHQSAVKNMTETACGRPPRDRSSQYNVTSITMCALTGVLVLVRLIFKQWFSRQRKLKLDDWVVMLAVLVGLPCTILNTTGLTANGLGRDVWTLSTSERVDFARYFFIQQVLYLFLSTTIKLSLVCFYLSIFPGRRVRVVLWSTVAINVAWGLACILVTVLQCEPVESYWTQYRQERGQCLNLNLLGWTNGAVSVAIDLWIIGIPLSQMKKLDLNWKKKIGAVIMFLTGAFVTIVSILRLQSLFYFYSSSNPTWDLWHIAWWSTIEINVGLICACLPTIRLILVRMWPRVFGSTMHSTSRASAGRHMMGPRRPQAGSESGETQVGDAPSPRKENGWETPSPRRQEHSRTGEVEGGSEGRRQCVEK